MSEDRLYACPKCGLNVQQIHVFCGSCGDKLPEDKSALDVLVQKQGNTNPTVSSMPAQAPPKSPVPLERFHYSCDICGHHQSNDYYGSCDICRTTHSLEVRQAARLRPQDVRQIPLPFLDQKACKACGAVMTPEEMIGARGEMRLLIGGGDNGPPPPVHMPGWADMETLHLDSLGLTSSWEWSQQLKKIWAERIKAPEMQQPKPYLAEAVLLPMVRARDVHRALTDMVDQNALETPGLPITHFLLKPCPECEEKDPLGVLETLGEAKIYFRPGKGKI